MAHTTTCPACGTTFRITAGQLLARGGDVRCGRCTHVFNAHATLTLDYPPAEDVVAPPTAAPEEPAEIPQEATADFEVVAEREATPQPEVEMPVEQASAPEASADETAAPAESVSGESPAEMEATAAPEEEWLLAGAEMTAASEVVPEESASVAESLADSEVAPLPESEGAAPEEVFATAIELPPEPEVGHEPEPAPAPEAEFVAETAQEPETSTAPMPETAGEQIAEFPLDFSAAPQTAPAGEEIVIHSQAAVDSAAIVSTAADETAVAAEMSAAFAALEPGETPPPVVAVPRRRNFRPLWLTGTTLLLFTLAGQGAMHFRSELIAASPILKPVFEQSCVWFGCQVSLPRDADLLSIEASSLEAGSGAPGLVTLNALLRNRAPHTQAFPLLELTLTDTQDALVARRIFQPAEYLPPQAAAQPGMLAEEEIDVRLDLDLGEVKAAGYRVYLFYPPNVS
jgi:predicted Zn finger-like uncharacterized protein